MNWHHWYWWTWPAGIAAGLTFNYVLYCVVPPRISSRTWLRQITMYSLWHRKGQR